MYCEAVIDKKLKEKYEHNNNQQPHRNRETCKKTQSKPSNKESKLHSKGKNWNDANRITANTLDKNLILLIKTKHLIQCIHLF